MLNNTVTIVTGGGGLVGREFAKAIVDNNGSVIIADINKEDGRKAVSDIKDLNKNASVEFCELDITSLDSIKGMISFVTNKFGKIDAVVNNAYPRNKNYGKRFEEVTYKDFCENVNIHLGGYFLVSQQLAEFFKAQGWGNIINMSSIYGVTAPRFEIYEHTKMTMPVEYAAIKSALIHLTKYMAKYYKNKNIRFNCISPGGILDDQPDAFINEYKKNALNKGMLETKDLTGTLVFLLSDCSKFINGQNIVVDDGWTL